MLLASAVYFRNLLVRNVTNIRMVEWFSSCEHIIIQNIFSHVDFLGTFYYKFVATEHDTGKLPLTYSLEDTALEWFAINSSTGNTTVKKKIDREVSLQT